MKKQLNKLFFALAALVCCLSCNDEWTDELYLQMVSFKAPLNSVTPEGVTSVYLPYKLAGTVTYNLPLIVSGSTQSTKDLNVQVVLSDTLEKINRERFGDRTELYFEQLGTAHYSYPATINIPKGECQAVVPIEFSLADLDQTEKWILPLVIKDDKGMDYQANNRQHYRWANLHICPFNAYSGVYQATAYRVYFVGYESEAIVGTTHTSYVVDENTVFFYAGHCNIDKLDRRHYKVYFEFTDERYDLFSNKLRIYTDPGSPMNLQVVGTPTYQIEESMDATRPYLKHRYITINLEYSYEDFTTIPGIRIPYIVKGSLMSERIINTQIPDEDQAIEW